MSNKSCPLCNKPIEDEHRFCLDCRDMADHQSLSLSVDEKEVKYQELLGDSESSELIDERPRKNKKSSKKLIVFVLIGSLFCLVMGLGGGYYVRSLKQSEAAEARYWEHCIEINTPLEYSKYLLRFPDGVYQQEAERRIVELRQQEYTEWLAVRNTYDTAKYAAFLAAYPETPHKAELLQLADSVSWVDAERSNTAEAYDAYIKNAELGNVNGDFTALAKEKYEYLSQLQPVEGAELESVKLSLDEFLDELSSSNLKNLETKFTPIITNFYGMENVSADEVRKAILAEIKEKKIEKLTYKPNFESLSVIKDNQNIYFAEFSLDRTIVYNKKKQETTPKSVVIELTFEKKIRSVKDKK